MDREQITTRLAELDAEIEAGWARLTPRLDDSPEQDAVAAAMEDFMDEQDALKARLAETDQPE